MPSVLFVCLGNICRSPAAECLLRKLAREQGISNLVVASCGMSTWNIGSPADARMSRSAEARGLTLDTRAKVFVPSFFDDFDWILAVDEDIVEALSRAASNDKQRSKVHLITRFSKRYANQPIPDPYHGGDQGFEDVLDMLEDSCQGFIDSLKSRY